MVMAGAAVEDTGTEEETTTARPQRRGCRSRAGFWSDHYHTLALIMQGKLEVDGDQLRNALPNNEHGDETRAKLAEAMRRRWRTNRAAMMACLPQVDQ